MQTSWGLLFLDTYGLLPLKLSAVGSPDWRWPESSRNLQRPSAVFLSQFSSSGELGGGEVVLVVTYIRQVAVLKCTFQF